jgi:mRNA interferase MazF
MYKRGDVVLIKFPFTNLETTKQRPALMGSTPNINNDFICFQITSNPHQDNIIEITDEYIIDGELKFTSFLKYDKCFTLNALLVNKKVGTVSNAFLEEVKEKFCGLL